MKLHGCGHVILLQVEFLQVIEGAIFNLFIGEKHEAHLWELEVD